MIDKINAPHENAHWKWDSVKSKAAYDFAVKIFGWEGRYTLSQWFGMMISYDKNVEPFADPLRLSKE